MKPACVPLFVVALALAMAPAPATAQPKDKDKKAEASGRAHFQRGQKLSADGDYVAAYREFAAGYAMTERPLFLFNMGEAARASGDIEKARESYRAFLKADPNNALAVTAQQRLDDIERASPTPPPPVGPIVPPVPPVMEEPARSPIETAPAPLAVVERPSEDRPVWKKWPFWAVVVGGAIAGGAIVYTVSRDDGEFCTGDCRQLNFR